MSCSRTDRLARDYREMLSIQDRPYLSWIAIKGDPPYAEEYLLTVRLRTYILSSESEMYKVGETDRCTVKVTLWDSYPHIAPNIRMLSIPSVFHPSWYSMGTYCPPEPWRPEHSLKDYVKCMLRTLIYDPAVIEASAPANYKALEWYMKNSGNTALFPSDNAELTENSVDRIAALEKAASSFGRVIDSWSVR